MFVSFFETCVLECFILKSNQMLFVISVLDFLSAPCKIYAKYYLYICNMQYYKFVSSGNWGFKSQASWPVGFINLMALLMEKEDEGSHEIWLLILEKAGVRCRIEN